MYLNAPPDFSLTPQSHIIRRFNKSSSGDIFADIALALRQAVHADMVIISQIASQPGRPCQTISFVNNGKICENFEYPLKDTPCENVTASNFCIFNGNVQDLFPNDPALLEMDIHSYVGAPLVNKCGEVIGVVNALYHGSLPTPENLEVLFQLFADLISSEMERCHTLQKMEISRQVIASANEGIVICDSQKNILEANKTFSDMLNMSPEALPGKCVEEVIASQYSGHTNTEIWNTIEATDNWSSEFWCESNNGKLLPTWLTINALRNTSGQIEHYALFFSDLTDHKVAEQKIHFQANYDSLTGLANRQLFLDRLDLSLHHAQRNNRQIAVLFIDLDLFKAVNDSLGHIQGDQLLRTAAKRLTRITRKSDTVARLGGDEFTMLMEDIHSPSELEEIANKILLAIAQPIELDGQHTFITASIGIAHYPNDAATADQLLSFADQAMYNAKTAGKNCARFFTREMQVNADQRLDLKHRLDRALSNQQITTSFQPIINLETGKIEKFESLVRWKEQGTHIPPAHFIPIAEEFGLIRTLGEQVLEQSCQALSDLHAAGYSHLQFSINRSAKEFPKHNDPHPQWLKIAEKYHLPNTALCFEVTESVLTPNSLTQKQFFEHLKNSGCQIAIDDFGTGYSSLSYLRQFPVDILKIDRSFISDFTQNEDDLTLVSTIIAMAKSLGMKVVAEGVETQEQLNQLVKLGCHYGQGYYFSKPLEQSQLLGFLQRHEASAT